MSQGFVAPKHTQNNQSLFPSSDNDIGKGASGLFEGRPVTKRARFLSPTSDYMPGSSPPTMALDTTASIFDDEELYGEHYPKDEGLYLYGEANLPFSDFLEEEYERQATEDHPKNGLEGAKCNEDDDAVAMLKDWLGDCVEFV